MEQPQCEWVRNCPQCSREMTYKLRITRDRASDKQTLCKSCGISKAKAAWTSEDRKRIGANIATAMNSRSLEQKVEHRRKQRATLAAWDDDKKRVRSERKRAYNLAHFKGEGNPFFGKHHSETTLSRLRTIDKSYTKTLEFSQRIKESMVGVDTSVGLIKLWTDKFGVDEALRRETLRREKISKAMSGVNNPMFGKAAPLPAGGGIKGWYGQHYFRSLRELSFMIELDKVGRSWKTGETLDYVVVYTNPYTGKLGTYRPDFIVDDTLMIECKPINLQNTVMNRAKAEAAITFCAQRDMTYEVVDPGKLNWDQLLELELTGVVKLTERTKAKLNEISLYS